MIERIWVFCNYWLLKYFKWVVVIKVWKWLLIVFNNWFWWWRFNFVKILFNNNKGGFCIIFLISCNLVNFKVNIKVCCWFWELYCCVGVLLIVKIILFRWGFIIVVFWYCLVIVWILIFFKKVWCIFFKLFWIINLLLLIIIFVKYFILKIFIFLLIV